MNATATKDIALFTTEQIDTLRAEYAKIAFVDPSLPTYRKLTTMLDSLPTANLKQLATAKVKFVSGLALNRWNRRTR